MIPEKYLRNMGFGVKHGIYDAIRLFQIVELELFVLPIFILSNTYHGALYPKV